MSKYKYPRETLVKRIKNSPVTDDGYYYCKNFKRWVNMKGTNIDQGYTFDRVHFKDKLCFNNAEIEVFLDKDKSNFDIYKMERKDAFLFDVIKDNLNDKLHKNIHNSKYTLGELIDSALFYYGYKY